MEKWNDDYPKNSNDPVWTRPYYGVQHRKNTPKNIHISVLNYGSFSLACYTDKDKNKHLNMSNFGHDKEVYCTTSEEARIIAESW